MRVRLLCLALIVALVGGACSRVATTTTTTSTTLAPTTTTTTVPDPVTVVLEGAPGALQEVVAGLYEWAVDPTGPAPATVPEGLVARLAEGSEIDGPVEVRGTASTGSVLEAEVAVVRADADVVLAVDEGRGWRVVGASLPRLGIDPWYGESPRMVFVIGSDARPGQDPLSFRADSLHVLTAVPEIGEGAIVGIPRDAYVEDPAGGRRKFTDLMASRGPEVVLEAGRLLTDLPLEGYLVTGFGGFVDLVNAFSGVEVDIPFRMAEPKSQAYFDPGPQHLDGTDALAFSRNRTLSGGDLTRSYHQGMVIRAALAKVQDGDVTQLPRLLEMLTRFVWTDLSAEELLTLGTAAYHLDPERVPNLVTPGVPGWAGPASVVYLTDGADVIFADLADGVLEPESVEIAYRP